VCVKIKSVGIIRKVCSLVNQSCLLTLYYSLLYPYISYCNIVWASNYPSSLQKIVLIQKNRLLDWQQHLIGVNHQLLCSSNYIFYLFSINIYQTCIFMYKYMVQNHSLPKVFNNYFLINSDVHSYPTRQAKNVHLPYFHTTLGPFSLKYRGPSLWNTIPSYIKTSLSLSVFKSSMKKHLCDC